MVAVSSSSDSIQNFDDERAANYDTRIRRIAPGYELLHSTVGSVLAERVPTDARILIVGAGTGAELEVLGGVEPTWKFTAIEPSASMRRRCRQRLEKVGLEDRVEVVDGTVEEVAFERRFGGATSILVSHFIDDDGPKHAFFSAIAAALQEGAPLVWADLFEAEDGDDGDQLMEVWRRELLRTGLTAEEVDDAFENIRRELSLVDEARFQDLLGDAGFDSPRPFFQSFLWGAWWALRQ